MYTLINAWDYSQGIEKVIDFYHAAWGNDQNRIFFSDAFLHSSKEENKLPRLYCLLKGDEIVGCCSLVINDFISRHDLSPWLAGVYIEESERGQELANVMMEGARAEAYEAGFETLYLTTDHDGFYERYGWERIEDGYDRGAEVCRIYRKSNS